MRERGYTRLLAAARARVVERIREVNATTESHTLAAGAHVHRVVEVASHHIARLRDVLVQRVGDGKGAEDESLASAIGSQSDHLRAYSIELTGAIEAHVREVAAVTEQSRSIASAARQIERLNTGARVLSMNARIEARRPGGAAVFQCIAGEMHKLASEIASANQTVTHLAQEMARTLPGLESRSRALGEMVTRQSEVARQRIDEVDAKVKALQERVAHGMTDSDNALAEIVRESHAAISQLQFQDVVAQGLLQVDNWLYQTQLETADPEAGPPVPPAYQTLGDGFESPPGGEDAREHVTAEAGEVMMF